jgi:ergothioneine biosynthesis protein EgtB
MAEPVEERFTGMWARTDQIFSMLAPDAWLERPIALRHPFVFYLGHLPAFAWNHVCRQLLERPSFEPAFDDLFSRGIDPDVDDPTRCHDHPDIPDRWPSVPEVLVYRDRVRAALLESVDLVAERERTHPMARGGRVFSLVIEHELMHQETLLYMLQRLDGERKVRPPWLPPHVSGPGRSREVVDIPAGRATLGAEFGDLPFGWDNEFPSVRAFVPAFALDTTPVTNAEFLAFIEDGGYRRPELWAREDWDWILREARRHPEVWEPREGRLVYRALFDVLPLDEVAGWPVYVSLAEARAYVRWRGGRLPTEAEFHRAAFGDGDGLRHAAGRADAAPGRQGNYDFRHWAPTPVGSHPEGMSPWGVHDLFGDGWEWTESVFAGFPGFEAYIPGYSGYSADFFDGKHHVLKGASWATARDLVRPSFRNWFQAHYPYVFAKFRCVTDASHRGLQPRRGGSGVRMSGRGPARPDTGGRRGG